MDTAHTPLPPALGGAYGVGMFARVLHSVGRFLAWVADAVMQVGGALNGGRAADKYATKLYEQPRDEYRP